MSTTQSTNLWDLMHATGKDAVEVNFTINKNTEYFPRGKQTKEYRYGHYGDIVVQLFDDGLTVTIYVPTGRMLVWGDRTKAFNYAKLAKEYVNNVSENL